ncbi:hypothetical protein MYP14_08335 [Rhodococcus pyridinivorans]|uniref:hypothetical protein n=1 Tax=Rhodococcus pyridinivorans TaxID=103816 RepID=UPI0020003B54|nr:hypothetical protein [Rhodococcus pyridinivorans]UPK65309.1 hypothetical protein MYP14_08335 [Rhodococcus pyridinivorans]
MFDPTFIATKVSNDWGNLGVRLPKTLKEAIAVYDEVQYVEAPHPYVDPKTITTDNVGDVVAQVTDDLVAAEKHAEAKRRVREALARQVLNAAGAAVPTILEGIKPGFEAAVTKFAKAAERLPDDLSSDSLVKAGPDALVALGEAREAAAEIKQVESYLASLVQLPAYSVFGHHPALRIFAPESPEQLSVLTNARNNKRHDPLVRELGPILWHGIKAGVPTALNTPDESARIRDELEEKARAAAVAARV